MEIKQWKVPSGQWKTGLVRRFLTTENAEVTEMSGSYSNLLSVLFVFFAVKFLRLTAATAAAATAAAATATAVVLGFGDFFIGRGAAEFEGHADVLADFLLDAFE